MTYLKRGLDAGSIVDINRAKVTPVRRQALIIVVEDGGEITDDIQPICDFLDIAIERLPKDMELSTVLKECHPMGVIAQLDCETQDGCHVMITVAKHDPTLPILLLVGSEPALAGAADAVEEHWQLRYVVKAPTLPGVGGIVDFLFHAGRMGNCVRMMPV
jgi:DNA-binding NtrC family response regulator